MSEAIDPLKLNTPNNEQKDAIEHNGGVLLSAGAGSGKTFVLVEHVVYLFREAMKSKAGLPLEEVLLSLKKEFSKIVIMTFTKKAAGELSLRLKNRFKLGEMRSLADLDDIESKYWTLGEEIINQMYVGTIHGFCFRLLGGGAVSGLSVDSKMIDDIELKEKLTKLFNNWLELSHEDEASENNRSFILFNKKAIIKSLSSIFSDPDLRVKWSEWDKNKGIFIDENIDELIEYSFENWREDFRMGEFDLSFENKKEPKWVAYLAGYIKAVDLSSAWSFLKTSDDYFKAAGRTPPVKEGSVEERVYDFFQRIKELKSFQKKYLNDLVVCKEKPEEMAHWGNVIGNIYNYIEDNYLFYEGITFSDLEYFVYKSLNSGHVSQEIYDKYNYFVIDEFQDTSQIQFDIVKMLTKNDMKKVFTVGDVKQAIYGFRGGELGVFKEASDNTYQNLSLKNNYRSDDFVISLNNSFFTYLLPVGENFEGIAKSTVDMTEQVVPDHRKDLGFIEKRVVTIQGEFPDGKKSLSSAEINYLESVEIYQEILERPEEEICILYSKLRPSFYLLQHLVASDVSFSFQVKVPMAEDPIISLFSVFCSYHGQKYHEDRNYLSKTLFVIKEISNVLNLDLRNDDNWKDIFVKSETWYKSFGALESFKKFLWSINISTSNIAMSWNLVETLSELGENKFEYIYEFIKPLAEGSYSIDFQKGSGNRNVTVMTVHASKGLEFNTVMLGGIHTNGDSKSSLDNFGKKPFSYKWFPKDSNRKAVKSPTYIQEYEESKIKDFGENKRLFYVALTRAVHKVVWCDLYHDKKPLSYSKNSWICALRKWEVEVLLNNDNDKLKQHIYDKHKKVETLLENYNLTQKRLDLRPAMIHLDSLGLREKRNEKNNSLILCSELSVTRLTQLDNCPREFYLRNMLKVDDSELQMNKVLPSKEVNKDIMSSSAERGTYVHEQLSNAILRNLTLELNVNEESKVDQKTIDNMEWVLGELKVYKSKKYNLISEKAVKFSLFGQMISGTPDLVLEGTNKEDLEIWDFKTGAYSEEKCRPYWLQLKAYALGLRKSQSTTDKDCNTVNMKLIFVDERKIITKKMILSEIEDDIFTLWNKLDDLDKVNEDHCPKCTYQELCFPHVN
jgi:ATP-dependent exoDNAse (exonuclease V) beta subunit